MKEHYGMSDVSYNNLKKGGVTEKQFFDAIKLFDPNRSMAKISYISIFYYIDQKGDFNKPPFFPHKKIAKAVYECLSPSEKMNVLKYLDDINDGEL